MDEILFLSNNWYKIAIVENLAKLMNVNVKAVKFEVEIFHNSSLTESIRQKLIELYPKFNKPIMIAKSGLYLEAYAEFPGINTTFISRTIGMKGLFKLIKGESEEASVKTVVGYFDGTRVILEEFNLKGKLIETESSEGWFFDPFFFPVNEKKSLLDFNEKDRIKFWEEPFRKVLSRLNENEQ